MYTVSRGKIWNIVSVTVQYLQHDHILDKHRLLAPVEHHQELHIVYHHYFHQLDSINRNEIHRVNS